METKPKPHYSIRQLSEKTGIPQSTLYDWYYDGDLEGLQIGKGKRIRIPTDIAKFHFPEAFVNDN